MRTDDFDYRLPENLIAQKPLENRESCRLLYLDKSHSAVYHRTFSDLTGILKKGDRLVLNNTRVIPARLFCRKSNGLRIELLFTEKINDITWKTLMKPARRVNRGMVLEIEGCFNARIRLEDILDNGDRVASLISDVPGLTVQGMLEQYGHVPLPPYIQREDRLEDHEAYQTVFAKNSGAVAAPTAGLHFTNELLEKFRENGVGISYLTLHVGVGTFRPVKENDPSKHPMHEEYFELPAKSASEINETRKSGGRVVAVGTTVVRVLEHCALSGEVLAESRGKTKLLILPPYRFKIVDGLITNFHLPKSTLLMLVCAFGGTESVLRAYNEAVQRKYRFFSYGDAMLLL
jgi:S-adenosylmethionine:tRNA ribosyltransferase-isomerase